MKKSQINKYINKIFESFKVSKRIPHTYYITKSNKLKLVIFNKIKTKAIKELNNIRDLDEFECFVGFEYIANLKD